jgi:hypothetical protein
LVRSPDTAGKGYAEIVAPENVASGWDVANALMNGWDDHTLNQIVPAVAGKREHAELAVPVIHLPARHDVGLGNGRECCRAAACWPAG